MKHNPREPVCKLSQRDRKEPPANADFRLPSDTPQPAQPPSADLEEPSDLDDLEMHDTDESQWDVFIPDDDQRDLLPDPADFWIEPAN